jgi:hypothetical protein
VYLQKYYTLYPFQITSHAWPVVSTEQRELNVVILNLNTDMTSRCYICAFFLVIRYTCNIWLLQIGNWKLINLSKVEDSIKKISLLMNCSEEPNVLAALANVPQILGLLLASWILCLKLNPLATYNRLLCRYENQQINVFRCRYGHLPLTRHWRLVPYSVGLYRIGIGLIILIRLCVIINLKNVQN